MPDLRLKIADFTIDLINKSGYTLQLEEGYIPFLSSEVPSSASVQVVARSGITNELRQLEKPIYSANFEGNLLWKIGKTNDGLRFHVFNSSAPFQLQQVAELNSDLTEWNVYSEPIDETDGKSLFPLLYPMGPLIMYYLMVKFDAIMIHGSGISDGGKGRIFTGVSGQGKTTMAKLWFDEGAEVLNDDRLIIRKDGNGYRVYNTPMFYEDKPRESKLEAIYSIHHSADNCLELLQGSEAVSAVTPNLIQHGYSTEIINKHLDFVTDLITTIPVYKLGFVPNNTVVEKLRKSTIERV